MTDNLSNNIPTPFTPSGTPSVLPDSPPPQEVAVDPIPPLPSMSASAANPPSKFGDPEPKVETVIEPDPPKPVEKPVTPPIPPPPSVPEENPAIRPPGAQSAVGDKSGDPYVKKHSSLPKTAIAGIASLVFLISSLSVGIYFNSRNFGIFDSRRYAADNMCNVDRQCSSDAEWQAGWVDARKDENKEATPVRDEYTNVKDDQSSQQGMQAEIIRHIGESGVGDPGAGNRTGEFVTTSGGAASNPTPTVAASGDGGETCPAPDTNTGACAIYRCYGGCSGICEENRGDIGCDQTIGSQCGQIDEECRRPNGQTYWRLKGGELNCSGSCSGGGGGGGPTSPPGGPTEPPVPTTPATISANCQSLVGQMSNGAGGWTTKTDAEFAASVRPGDGVRFVCTGHKTQGAFTKAAFFINGTLHVNDVVKLNADQYAVEYTIPAAGSLEVESVLLHDSKGWVD